MKKKKQNKKKEIKVSINIFEDQADEDKISYDLEVEKIELRVLYSVLQDIIDRIEDESILDDEELNVYNKNETLQ